MQKFNIVAIDFGSKKLSASLANLDNKEVDIQSSLTVKSSGIEKGFIKDKEKCIISLNKLINEIHEKQIDHGELLVYAGISARGLRITEATAEIVLKDGCVTNKIIDYAIKKNQKDLVLSKDEMLVDFEINYYSLDGKVINENISGWRGNTLKINLTYYIGNSFELTKLKSVIEKTGCIFGGFKVNIAAGKKIFISNKKVTGTKALIDIGAETTDIAVFCNGVVKYIDCVPVGGNNITKDLSICGEFSVGEAEKIKNIMSANYESLYNDEESDELIEVGTSKVSRKLFYEITEARIDEILKIVNDKLKKTSYYEDICSIILYGDGISYFQNMQNKLNLCFEKGAKLITSEYLGINEIASITSLAMAKDIFDKNVLLNNNKKVIKEYEKNLSDSELTEKTEEGIVDKIKGFLGRFI